MLNKGGWCLRFILHISWMSWMMKRLQLLCVVNKPFPARRVLMTTFSFLSQLFFPECMISDSADVSKGMTSSELIQVNQLKSGASITAIHRRKDKLKGKKSLVFKMCKKFITSSQSQRRLLLIFCFVR